MNLIEYLLISFLLAILVITIFLQFKGTDIEESIFSKISNGKQDKFESGNIPTLEKLLELEKIARKEGSNISFNSLIGSWEFISVWKRETDKEDSFSSSLLRLFSARLELTKIEITQDEDRFSIRNSIEFGFLSINFLGEGYLKGLQPLLPFFFERIELRAGERILLKRSIDIPSENNMPFFALIGMGKSGKWLSARGRGGGLALWLKA